MTAGRSTGIVAAMKLTNTVRAVLATAIILTAIPATASAGTLKVPVISGQERVTFIANPGEDNDVEVRPSTEVDNAYVITDRFRIDIVDFAHARCNYLTADEKAVRCEGHPKFGLLEFRLGDEDNRYRSTTTNDDPVSEVSGYGASSNEFHGGSGPDNLRGSDDADDVFFGGKGSDTLTGHGGNDELSGGLDANQVFGNDGQDRIVSGAHAEHISGGPGGDTVSYENRIAPVNVSIDGVKNDGVAGELDNVQTDVEHVIGGPRDDVITDLAGTNNFILGGGGNDKIDSGGGVDDVSGGPGNDKIDTGAGNDMAFGNDGNDYMTGGADTDLVLGEAGQDEIKNSPGADTMGGGADFDIVSYSASTQRITADIGGPAAGDGAAGEGDTISGDVEQLMGGAASDTLAGDEDGNLIIGLDGNDVIEGRGGVDSLYGGNDNDTLKANDGVKDTTVNCGADADQVDADALDAPVACEGAAAPAGAAR
jgi:Ca2+-binding RTX toxin-like protein